MNGHSGQDASTSLLNFCIERTARLTVNRASFKRSIILKTVFLTGAIALAAVATRAEAQQTRTLTFAEAIAIATKQASDVLIARQGTVAAEEHKASTKGGLFPHV